MFREVKNVLQYGRDGLKFDTMVSSLHIRDSKLKLEKKEFGRHDKKDSSSCDTLFARGKSSKKEDGFQKKGRSQSKEVKIMKP